ncbi:MAG: NAD-dependent epimerase/dehydratase family protein [Geminicoccaceae bacterium]
MSVLVTGGGGFIGSHLVERLTEVGHAVRVLDDFSTGSRRNLPRGVEVHEGCVTDATAVAAGPRGVDAIFHLAAIASVVRSNDEWLRSHAVNQGGTVTVFNSARARRLPVVYASSAAVFGRRDRMPLCEGTEPSPITAYGADKYGCELHAQVAARIHQVPNVGLRFFNVYGPRQPSDSPYSGVITTFVDRVERGLPLCLHGDGGQTRDFIHVSDVVEALVLAMERCRRAVLDNGPWAEICNVCTGLPTSVRRIAELAMAVAGRRVPLVHGPPRVGDIRESVGDPRRAAELLGFRARIRLAEGLASVLSHSAQARASA